MRVRVAAAILAGATFAAGAQGIDPGAPSSDAIALPHGFEAVLQLRTFFMHTYSLTGTQSEAWAAGGWAGLRSPWLADFLQLGVVGYTSQPLYAPADKPGTKLLLPDQGAINALGEAFVSMRAAGQIVTAYRQLLDRPFLDASDKRMVPNTFEAYTLRGSAAKVDYIAGYVTKIKIRDADSFSWMSNAAGGMGAQRGVAFAGATWSYAPRGYVRVDEQYGFDVFNTFAVEGRYGFEVAHETALGVAAQYFPQRSAGEAQIGAFSTYGAGVQATLDHGPFGLTLSYTQTGRGFATQNPFGEHPSFIDFQQIKFNSAGEKAWAVFASVDCARWGARGLTASAAYASGWDVIDPATGMALPDQNETDVRTDYDFGKGFPPLRGLVATFRYSWLRQPGSPTATDLRAYVNYAVSF